MKQELIYWSGENEIDFIIREGNTVTQIWQAVAGKLDDPEMMKRELRAILEAKKMFPAAEALML